MDCGCTFYFNFLLINTLQIKDIISLFKVRLSLTVVLTSVLCYGIAIRYTTYDFDGFQFLSLFLGGTLITFAANAFNQILEKEQDSIMKRTQKRPLVQNSMTVSQAFIIASVTGILAFVILLVGTNPFAAVIALLSLILYSFVYTPSKKYTSFCVFIGAIPGALPPLIGYIAVTGQMDLIAWYVFIFQFIWQFPHFWAIAWQLNEDYTSVGYKMLPSSSGLSKVSAFIILIYTIISAAIGTTPFFIDGLEIMNLYDVVIVEFLGLYFIYRSVKLLQNLDNTSAKKLMLASLIYMPLTYILIWI